MKKPLILIRGGGDLATGSIHRLHQAGFPLLVTETGFPSAIRRQVAFSEAVYEGSAEVEGVTARRIDSPDRCQEVWAEGCVPLLVDPDCSCLDRVKPEVLVDAILAKRNLGTRRDMAPLTIALGPGFTAGTDVDFVIETKRGHDLGRILRSGTAVPNTGVPGRIGGYAAERVLHAEQAGRLYGCKAVGDFVEQGEVIACIRSAAGEYPVRAGLSGLLRGLIRDGYPVTPGFKIADIDPRREELKNCFTISDKARCIAGSVLELVCDYTMNQLGE